MLVIYCFSYASGFIPVCTLGLSQVGRINLGQNVSSLRYFAICGLQEGFEPFAINMKRDTTMWFSKSLPQFVPVPADHNHIEVIIFSQQPSLIFKPRIQPFYLFLSSRSHASTGLWTAPPV